MVPRTTQRSFRLPAELMRRLQDRAEASGESVNAVVTRYLSEGERMDTHPHITFWTRTGGREAMLVGHRLSVAEVIETLRGRRGSVKATARELGLAPWEIEACADYYADHAEEIDDVIRRNHEFAERHEAAAGRRQRALGT